MAPIYIVLPNDLPFRSVSISPSTGGLDTATTASGGGGGGGRGGALPGMKNYSDNLIMGVSDSLVTFLGDLMGDSVAEEDMSNGEGVVGECDVMGEDVMGAAAGDFNDGTR